MTEIKSSEYFDDFIKIPFVAMKLQQVELEEIFFTDLNLNQKLIILSKRIYYWTLVFSMIFSISLSGKTLIFSDPFDMEKATLGINVCIAMSTIVWKSILQYFYGVNIVKIANDLRREYTKIEVYKYKIDTYTSKVRKFGKTYAAFWIAPVVMQFSMVLLVLILTGQKTFPLFIQFPEFFNASNNFVYPFLFLYIFWSLSSPSAVMISFDTALFNLVTAISMEFNILSEDVKSLKSFEQQNIFVELGKIIDRQNKLFDITLRLENVFTSSNFYNLLMSSICICFFAFILSTTNDIYQIVLMGTYCTSTIYLLYLECNYGQILMDASIGLMDKIYDCGWENFDDLKVKKQIVLMLMRSKKPAKLTVMGFANITKGQFTSVSIIFC